MGLSGYLVLVDCILTPACFKVFSTGLQINFLGNSRRSKVWLLVLMMAQKLVTW